ncbi:MAG TPA: hypothetical protein PK317_01595 [Coprothermobacter proteolyticus]|nr:hypothetical protein [Coprothermobacter proteolyticus]
MAIKLLQQPNQAVYLGDAAATGVLPDVIEFAGDYRPVKSVQGICIGGTTTATLQVQWSLDGTNWVNEASTIAVTAGAGQATYTNSFKFLRVNATALGASTKLQIFVGN